MPYSPLELANAFIQTGELTDALDALNQQLMASPMDDDARRLRIETLMRFKDDEHLQMALADLDQLANLAVDDLYKRSVIQEKPGHLDAALASIAAALHHEPTSERLIERQVHLLRSRGDYVAALRILESLPLTWRWQQWRGDLAVLAGKPDDAIRWYTDALAQLLFQTDGLPEVWAIGLQARLLLARAKVYHQQLQFDAAEVDYLTAKYLIPNDPMIDFQLGLIAWQRGQQSEAIALCQAGWQAASSRLREEMQRELTANSGQMALAKALQIDQNG